MTPVPVLTPVLMKVDAVGAVRSPEHVARQRAVARDALRLCAQTCGAPSEGWTQREDGAPLPNGKHYWSISHKADFVVAVIAETPVGIDIERIAPRPRALHDALAGDEEWSVMGDRSWHSFFRLWTAKEAVLKANGLGIGRFGECIVVGLVDDDRLLLEFQSHTWQVRQFFHADHVAAVATEAEVVVEWRVVGGDAGSA